MKRFVSVLAMLMLLSSVILPVYAEDAAATDSSIGESIIVEVGDSEFTTQGGWANNSSLLTPSGAPSWFTSSSGTSAQYEASLEPGTYEVYFWRLSHTANNDANVKVTIAHDGKTEDTTVSFEGSSIDWELIGSYYFNGEGGEYVNFARDSATDSSIVTRTGAVRFVKVGGERTEQEAETVDETGQLLSITGITAGIQLKEGTAPSRAEFLKMAMSVVGIGAIKGSGRPMFADVTAEHSHYGIIAAAIDCKIISGDGNGYFRPDDAVTYQEAVKMLVSTLGYDSRAMRMGRYPGGYLSVASLLGILNGAEDGGFDGKTVANMLYRALFVKPDDVSGELPVQNADLTALEAYHDIYFGKGVINGISGLSLTQQAAPGKSNVRIGEELFHDPNSLAPEYIGCKVSYYYKGETDKELLLLVTAGQNEVLEIPADEIVSAEVFGGNSVSIRYDDGSSNIKMVAVKSDAQVVYNSRPISPPYSDSDFQIKSGMLRLISNGGGGSYDYIFVYDYETHVVNSVNESSQKIYVKYGSNALDLSKKSGTEYKLVSNSSGKELTIGELKEWDVLSVPANSGRQADNPLTILVSTKRTKAVVEEVTSDGVVLKGKTYKIADSFRPYASGITPDDTACLGKTITVFTDINGYIAAADIPAANAENYVYGYWISGSQSGVADNVTLNVFTEDGVWEKIELDEEVVYNGKKMKPAEAVTRDGGLINLSKFDEMVQVDSDEHIVSVSDRDKVQLLGSNWLSSDNANVLGPNNEPSYYTNNKESIATYSAAGIPAGTYGLYYWRTVLYSSTTGLDVTVNHADGTYTTRIDETLKGDGRSWEFLGNFTFDGSGGDVSFQLSADSATADGKASVQRTAAIKFGAPVLNAEEPSDYLYKLALPIEQPLYVEKNSEGLIDKIDTLTPGANFSSWLYYANTRGFVNNGSREKIEFAARQNTLIFGVPSDTEDMDGYSIVSLGDLRTEHAFACQPFNLDENLRADVMVMRVGSSIQDSLPQCILVNRVGKGLNSEGAVTTQIRGWQSGSEVSYIGADENTFQNVKAGDIILASRNKNGDTNSDTGGYQILMSFESGVLGQNGNLHSDYCTVFGEVKEVEDGGAICKIHIGSEDRIYYLNGATVYVYDRNKERVSVGSLSDVSPEDKIFVRIRRCGAEEVVLYR